MRIYKKNVVVFAAVVFLVAITWVAVLTGPDVGQDLLLEKKLSELRDRLHFADVLNKEREHDVHTLRRQFHLLHQELVTLSRANGSQQNTKLLLLAELWARFLARSSNASIHVIPDEIRHLIGNLSYGTSDIAPPSIYHFLPHLIGHPDGLQPSFKLSQARVGVSVVMGIPTIKRDRSTYIFDTLQSILDGLNEEEKDDCLIVVMVSEPWDEEFVRDLAGQIQNRFSVETSAGLIEVISPPPGYYPDLDKLKLTFGDPKERVKWRTKQNLDYAFLMMYARSRGTYYLQLEDDIITKPGFLSVIKNFALNQKLDDWLILEFSLLGFIGKLFKSSDLPLVVEFFLLFYRDKPIDWLLDHLLFVKTCNPEKDAQHCERMKAELKIRFKPSLFQHVGTHSSLKGKVQKLKDRYFGKTALHRPHNNPPASVSTTLKIYRDHSLERAYRGETFFWALLPHPGDTVSFKFVPPIEIEKYYFKSGNSEHPGDQFYNTTVEVLPYHHVDSDQQEGVLSRILPLEEYPLTDEGYLVIGNFTSSAARGVVAPSVGAVDTLRLHCHSTSQNWLILSEIYIKPRIGSSRSS